MPLYNLINSIEQAHRQSITTLVTFWDIRRAFDSIPRNLQRLAWAKLCVPEDVAEWFVSMDNQGTAYIATPFYSANKPARHGQEKKRTGHHLPPYDQEASPPQSAAGYQPQRGIGQGREC